MISVATASLGEILVDMEEHSQSVTLNWGEDNNLWECSWITGGVRYTSFSRNPRTAAQEAWTKAFKAQQV